MVLLSRSLETSMSVKGRKAGISVHDWAQVNNWRSRPSTQASTRGGAVSVFSPRSETDVKPELGLRRCKTMLERPYKNKPVKQKSESCTLDYIQYLKQRNKESEAKLKNTINVLSIARSKSDLDTHEQSGFGPGHLFPGVGMLKERAQVYLPGTPEHGRQDSATYGKQEMRMGVAGVAKRGLIHLSTNDDDTHMPMDDFALHGVRRTSVAQADHASAPKTKSLIKRKDIIEQIRQGTQRLEEEEAAKLEQEQMTKSLGDYTILDLQSKILEMTDTKPSRKGTPTQDMANPRGGSKKKDPQGKGDKGITLPAINNLNPFSMNSK